MAKLNTIALSDTFGTWLSGANESYARINQFAVNESSLYANTFSANVALQVNTIRQRVAGPITINANTNFVGTFANLTTTNTNITGGSLLVSSNVNFTGAGLQIQGGEIDLYTDTGSPSYIKFFCENTNQHGIKIESPTHAEMIGASNRALTIPAANGYLMWASASDDSRQTISSNVHFSGANVHFDGANVMYKGQLLDTRYANTTNLALKQTIAVERAALANTNAYIATKTTESTALARLANTNAYIASMSTDVQLANTNAYIAAVAAADRSALANTNTRVDLINTNLTGTNTAIRLLNTNTQTALDTQEAKQASNLANTNSYIAGVSTTASAALPKAGGTMTGTLQVNAALNTNNDIKITAGGNRYIGIESTNGLATMEIGGATGSFIDLKHPYSDDFDMRIGVSTSGGYLSTSAANFAISANTHISNLLTVDGDTTAIVAEFISDTSDAAVVKITNQEGTDHSWGLGVAGSSHAAGENSFYVRDETAGVNRIMVRSNGVTYVQQSNSSIYTNQAATGSVALDFTTYTHFHLKLTGNLTLTNPTTEISGTSGLIWLKQDTSGSRTLSLGTDYETPASAGHTLSTAANSIDVIPYYVVQGGSIVLGQVQRAFG